MRYVFFWLQKWGFRAPHLAPPWFGLKPQAVLCWWSSWEPMCRSAGLLLCFHLCTCAVVGFAHLIHLADGKAECSKKVFALLPRPRSAVRGCIFAGTSLMLGRYSSVPGVSPNPGVLKGISLYCSVFRQVSDTQIQGRTKNAFKVSESLLGRVILGLKYCPWKLWSGVCCA